MAQIVNNIDAERIFGKQIMEQCEQEGRIPVILDNVGRISVEVKDKKDLKGVGITKTVFLPDDAIADNMKRSCSVLANSPARSIYLIKKEHLSKKALELWGEK